MVPATLSAGGAVASVFEGPERSPRSRAITPTLKSAGHFRMRLCPAMR